MQNFFDELIKYFVSLTFVASIVNFFINLQTSRKLEKLKLKNQMQMHTFSQYMTNRYEKYALLYKLFLITKSSVQNKLREYPDFKEYNKDDIATYLERKGFTNQVIQEVVRNWEIQKNKEVRKIYKHLYQIDMNKASRNIAELQNHLYINELYLSESVAEKAKETLENIQRLLINYEDPDEETKKENPILIRRIEDGMRELKTQLKKEMKGELKEIPS
ncbi:hypothetical protein M5W68_12070 [Paenibacillus larvae]|uniref:hypothetical protein n=1 Tax=Paenibacillus larvae TaxID=1464 RepID=UPI00227FD28A|nr:hypothetical protein [Paenibacillus larvae]MCY9510609.1 hypothetical protein [Paenibacillus larvae]MCY9525832.1 hypothetical protein [Paenibacillus larvae]